MSFRREPQSRSTALRSARCAGYIGSLPLYPEIQAYLRTHRPPTLITWGAGDTLFTQEGAEAFLRDVPHAELHLLDTGHFALEDYGAEIAGLMRRFLGCAVHR